MIPKEIIIHHSVSSRDKTKIHDIEEWHKLRWPDFVSSLGWHIGYHFVITGDGKITQTRACSEMGAHSIPNEGRIGICLTGNFEEEEVTKEQTNSLVGLLERLKIELSLDDTKIFGHREKGKTLCPGKNLMKWVNLYRKVGFLQKQIQKLKDLISSFLKVA